MVIILSSQLMGVFRDKQEAVKNILKKRSDWRNRRYFYKIIPLFGSLTEEHKPKSIMNTAQVSWKSIFSQTKLAAVLRQQFRTSLRLLQFCHVAFLIFYNARFLIKRKNIRWIKKGLIGRYQWAGLSKEGLLRETPGPTVFSTFLETI